MSEIDTIETVSHYSAESFEIAPKRFVCYDDGTGRNVYFYKSFTKKQRQEPPDFQHEYFSNDDRKYYFKYKCIRCKLEPFSPIFLSAKDNKIGFAFNLCEECLLKSVPNIKCLRGNGDAIWEANKTEPKHCFINLYDKTFSKERNNDLIDRCLVSKHFINIQAKARRDEYRRKQTSHAAKAYMHLEEGIYVYLSYGFGHLFNEFVGYVSEGVPHGDGVMFYSDKSIYYGNWRRGERHSDTKGVYIRSDGSSYEGTWLQGLKHGKGTQVYPDGSVYTGEFAKGREHGQGKRKYADGSTFEGRYRFGRKDGPGVLTKKDGSHERNIFKENIASYNEIQPVIGSEEKEDRKEDGNNPINLKDLCMKQLCSTMIKQKFLVPSNKLAKRLPSFFKNIIGREYLVNIVPEITPKFVAIADSLAFFLVNEIKLSGYKISHADCNALMYFQASNKSLTKLSLTSAKLQSISIDIVCKQLQSRVWNLLTTLDLSYNSLDMNSIQNLCIAVTIAVTLDTVKLAGCNIKSNGAFVLGKMLATNRNITEFDLAFNTIEALGAESISQALITNKTLLTLNLRQNNIGTTGGIFFADALSKNHHLRVLILVDNSLGTENICLIAGKLKGRFGDVAKSLRIKELDMPSLYEEGRFFHDR